MTKEKLKEYRSMKDEIAELEERGEGRALSKAGSLRTECNAIERFVEGIQDSITRRIFRMVYLDGKSFEEVGKRIHMDRSTIGKRIKNFLKNQ